MVKENCVRLRAQIRRSLQCRSSPGSRRNLLAKATTIHLSPKKILHTSKRRLSFGAYTAQHRTRNISAHFHVFSATLDPFLHIFCHFLYTARYFLLGLCMFFVICQNGHKKVPWFRTKMSCLLRCPDLFRCGQNERIVLGLDELQLKMLKAEVSIVFKCIVPATGISMKKSKAPGF